MSKQKKIKEDICKIDDPDFYARRRTVIIIENDTIGNGFWNPHLVKTLRDWACLLEKTGGSGAYPQHFKCKNGNKITIHSGTYCEGPLLDEAPDSRG